MSYIDIVHVQKIFDGKHVLKDINLSVEKGEFVAFLGSSGCGKTTLLRCLVGLEQPDHGAIWLDGKEITPLSPQERGISMIFQQYCIFPTMNVYDNVSFGLRMQKRPRAEIRQRVDAVLEMVDMRGHEKKYAYQLSGGEQQRIALARGLVMNPKVLLLDEPFSAIDAKLRKELQIYLKELHKELGMTSIFVTHDQEEAMRMSDTIYLFHEGVLTQSGSPWEIYARPKTPYVAGFIGSYNLCALGDLLGNGQQERVAIRPEVIKLFQTTELAEGDIILTGEIVRQIPQGSIIRNTICCDSGLTLNVDVIYAADYPWKVGQRVQLAACDTDVIRLEEDM